MAIIVSTIVITIVVVVIVNLGWKVLNWAWLNPKKLEKLLKEQGYRGNSYKLLRGDIIELANMVNEARSKPMPISHDITLHIMPFDYHIFDKYGIFFFFYLYASYMAFEF